ncbi:hypothetical protein CAPTEDRAFT_166474 [Capitella teleta]|uniref:BHLH domain-containing protein n=1 Tax=Capitella teleta TaxID=283909 RepID=R7TAA2_CAPTE|nr:hypothetical protein CAPTEDRAFT_166474 [Capitella teleta]|eukprot:ELT88315.1 hypothetical protein CAPTEDRAFT_166474 [Capitella teleta]
MNRGRNSRASLASELFDPCPSCVQNRHGHQSKRHRIKSPSPAPSMTKHSLQSNTPLMEFDEVREGASAWSLSEVEFYGDMSSPNMDIWNKFEMGQPTPPASPERDSSTDGDDFSSQSMWDSLLDSQLNFAHLNEPLNTKLIQDCMWSATQPDPDKPRKPTNSAAASAAVNRSRTVSCSGDAANSLDCVDPTSVFPYPISAEAKTCLGSSNALITAPSTLTASSSVFDTPSPSESEDDEEIDVVTVPTSSIVRKSSRGPSSVARNLESASAQVAAMHNYSNVNHSAHSDHHYSQPYSTQSAPQSPQISAASTGAVSVLKRSRPMSMPSSPQPFKNSDSEEGEGKRAQHNVLERKRRNDLKYSFCTLRACVPDISSAERTPKVTILKKASEHVISLKRRHNSLEVELARQKHRQEQLRAKLNHLKDNDLFL